ncbi:TniQ family protein [Rhizobium mesosinicum]|uniref:TniQ family protein n=1 Tax=Rhizobium mesosinicum TaxID=335017 RepID=A0ABS7GPL1_9HYPH|nr:TniQ family protein [Rhizobium mesosinicum]MBW9051159.1 TniQ family protein [Rhizobium mesosinicum]
MSSPSIELSGLLWESCVPIADKYERFTDMLKIQLHDDETLTSFVSRLARANGVQRMRTFCIDLGIDVHKLKLGDRDQLVMIADLTGVPVERLMYSAAERSAKREVRLGNGWVQPSRLNRTYLRFCPHCIVDDNNSAAAFKGTAAYYRMQWFLPQLTTCAKHCSLIVEADAPKGLETNSHDFCAILERLGGQDLLLKASIPRTPTAFETHLLSRISSSPSSAGPLIDILSLEALIVMSERLGIAALHGRAGNPRKLTSEQIHTARSAGFSSLSNGMQGVKTVLDTLVDCAPYGSHSAHGLYGTLYMALQQSYENAEYDVFRSTMAEHATATGRLTPGTRIFDNKVTVGAVKLRDLATRVGVDPARLRREMRNRGTRSPVRSAVKSNDARDIEEHFASLWTYAEARRFLGCNLRGLHSLFDAKIIDNETYGLQQGYCHRQGIYELAARIRQRATTADDLHLVPLMDATRPASSSVAEVLNYILAGKLSSVAINESLPILMGTKISVSEVRQAHVPHGYLTAADARAHLHLSLTGFAALIANGILSARSLGYPRQDWWILDNAEVERFRASYISLQECAAITGLSANALSNRAKRGGLVLAIPIERAGQAIYDRRHTEILCGREA